MNEVRAWKSKDLIVIGGGINGAGIAADAAGRGLSVLMLEARDLACATSSASSKTDSRRPALHGTLRIPPGQRSAGGARGVIKKMAPHLAFPMRFRLPHRPHLRPAWMIRIGLFFYTITSANAPACRARPVCALARNRYLSRKSCAVSNIPTAGSTMRVWFLPTPRWWYVKAARFAPAPALSRQKRENGLWVVEAEDIDSGEKNSPARARPG